MESAGETVPERTASGPARVAATLLGVALSSALGLLMIGPQHQFWHFALFGVLVTALGLVGLQFRQLQRMANRTDEHRRVIEESERRYRMIVAAMPELILISRNGRIDFINPGGCDLLGVPSADRVLGSPVIDLVDAETNPGERARLVEGLENQQPFECCDMRLDRLDGSSVCVELSGVPIMAGGGPLVLLIARDISEHRRIETSLREAKEQAELANRTKSQFLANMSHELRTPLNAIIGFSEIIAEESFGPSDQPMYTEYARDIRDSGQHLLTVINDILE